VPGPKWCPGFFLLFGVRIHNLDTGLLARSITKSAIAVLYESVLEQYYFWEIPEQTRSCMTFYDIMTTKRSDDPDVKSILAIYVNAETDSLDDDEPSSVGVHPRDIADDIEDVLFTARDLAHTETVVAIGPCGLDRSSRTGWAEQIHAFEDMVSFSELVCKPLLVHCVRAHADVVTLNRELQTVQPWVVLNFIKGPDTLERLVEAGIYVAFGSAIMQDGAATDSVVAIPADRLFLATGDDASVSVKQLYERVAQLRGCTVQDLCTQIEHNYESVFNH